MEAELKAIMEFILKTSGITNRYYESVPENFKLPAVFFPMPEIDAYGETFGGYCAEYNWYINFFDVSNIEAYKRASMSLTAIKENRNIIPVGDNEEKGVRVCDPKLRPIDDGVVKLAITFKSHRPYKSPEKAKAHVEKIFIRIKGGKDVEEVQDRAES